MRQHGDEYVRAWAGCCCYLAAIEIVLIPVLEVEGDAVSSSSRRMLKRIDIMHPVPAQGPSQTTRVPEYERTRRA